MSVWPMNEQSILLSWRDQYIILSKGAGVKTKETRNLTIVLSLACTENALVVVSESD